MLNIDGTLILQIANFLVLLLILNLLLFKPIRRILSQREQEMDSRRKTIDDYQGRVAQKEKDIEEGKVQARKDGFSTKESLKNQGLEEEKGILQEAGAAVEKKLDSARKDIEAKMVAAREALEGQVAGFSKDLAQKILGRSVQ
jgi:F-type H+-transporting ATPase subunit b